MAVESFTYVDDKRPKLTEKIEEDQANMGLLKITVKDTGCGIAEHDFQKLF